MGWIIFFGIIAVFYYFANNKEQNSSYRKVKTYQRKQIDDGYIEIETVTTQKLDNVDFNINKSHIKSTGDSSKDSYNYNNIIEIDITPNTKEHAVKLESKPYNSNLTDLNSKAIKNKTEVTQGYIPNSKLCNGCNKTLPISQFSSHPTNPDGKTKWCTSCLKKSNNNSKANSDLKKCNKCGNMRRHKSFYQSSKTTDGLSKWCVFCHEKHNRLRRN